MRIGFSVYASRLYFLVDRKMGFPSLDSLVWGFRKSVEKMRMTLLRRCCRCRFPAMARMPGLVLSCHVLGLRNELMFVCQALLLLECPW